MSPITNAQMAARRKPAFSRRGQPITFREFTGKNFDPSTGETAPTFSSRTIAEALVWDLTTTAITASEGRYRVRDKSCRVLMNDLPTTSRPPSKESKVIIGTTTWSIIDVVVTGDNQAVDLILRDP